MAYWLNKIDRFHKADFVFFFSCFFFKLVFCVTVDEALCYIRNNELQRAHAFVLHDVGDLVTHPFFILKKIFFAAVVQINPVVDGYCHLFAPQDLGCKFCNNRILFYVNVRKLN